MYFLLRRTPYGIIKISCDGLHDFAREILSSRLRLYSITLLPSQKEQADMTIVISEDDLTPHTKSQVENHISEVLKPLGINAAVVWASSERGIFPVIQSPYTWGIIAACLAVIFTAGLEGFFWTAFWAAAAWFGVMGLGIFARRFRRV